MNRLVGSTSCICSKLYSVLRLLCISAALIGLSLGSVPLYAADQTWDGDASGLWATGTNWDGDPADGDVPGANDTALFNGASGNTTINLGGTLSSGGITFDGAAAAYTIGVAGDVLNLSVTYDDTDGNDADIIMTSTVANDQTIAADITLGDGTGTSGFTDENRLTNNSILADLVINGDISSGSGGTPLPDTARLWLNGDGDIIVSGDINEAGSASDLEIFVSGDGTTTFSGTDNSTTENYTRWRVRDNGTLEVTGSDGSLGSTGATLDIRYGTITLNQDQSTDTNILLGSTSQGVGASTLNIADGSTLTMDNGLQYFADDTNANTAVINGGELLLTDSRTFTIDDNTALADGTPELVINSDFASTAGSFNLTIANTGGGVSGGTIRLNGINSRSGNGINLIDVRSGGIQITADENLGDNDVLLGRGGTTGTLEYVGSSAGTIIDNEIRIGRDRVNTSDTAGGIVLNNGSGPITFRAARFNEQIQQSATVTRTLELGGANTDANTIRGGIRNNETANNSNNQLGAIEVTKTGAGTWILAGANTYTGDTDINAGRLDIQGSVTSNVNVADGANLGGEGTVTGNIVFGTSASSTLIVDGYSSDALTVTGDIDTQFGVDVVAENSGAGAFTVLNYGAWNSGSGGADLTDFTTSADISSRVGAGTFADTGSAITLDLGFESRTWNNGGADGFWNTTSANWVEGDNLYVDGDHVIFDGTSNGALSISNGGATVSPGSITFAAGAANTINAATTETITVGSGGLNFFGNANADDVRINAGLIGSGNIYRSGGSANNVGQVILAADNSAWTGTTLIGTGDLQINNINALGDDASNTITLSDETGDDPQFIINAQGTLNNTIILTDTGGNKNIRFDNGGNTNSRAATIAGDIIIQDTNSIMNFAIEGQTDRRDIGGSTSGNVARSTHTLTLNGLISSSTFDADSYLQKSDQGVLILGNANNNFTGGLYINSGTIEVGSIGNIGEASHAGAARADLGFDIRLGNGGSGVNPENATGTLIYTGAGAESTDRQIRLGGTGNSTVQGTGGGTIANNGGGGLTFTATNFNSAENSNATRIGARTLTLAGTFTGENEIQGIIVDNLAITDGAEADAETVGITVDTDGIWKLSGTNTYSGKTSVTAGTLRISDETNIGANPAFSNADALSIEAAGILNTTATMTIDDANRGVEINGGTIDTDASTVLTVDNVISGTGLNKAGDGGLVLNATNTFTTLNINEGTVTTGVSGTVIADTATVTLADVAGAGLNLGSSETIGSIDGGGATGGNLALGTNTLTVGDANSTSYAGEISGTGGLTKIGSGTLTLSGANTYTGATTVTSGALDVAGTLTSSITLGLGTTLSGEGSTSGLLTFDADGSDISVDGSTAGAFTSVGLNSGGNGTGLNKINFAVAPTGTGDITVLTYGSGFTGTTADFSIGTGLSLSGRGGTINDTGSAITVSTGSGSRTWNNSSTDSLWTKGATGSTNWIEGDNLFYDGDFVTFNDSAGADQTVTLSNAGAEIAPTSVTLSNDTDNYSFGSATTETLSATGGISVAGAANVTFNSGIIDPSGGGTTSIEKVGSGVLTLSTANTHSGGTTLTNGTLNINNAGALGTGTLDINGGIIDNTSGGAIVNTGANTQTWDGDFTFTGTNDLNIGTGAVTLGGDRTVTVSGGEFTIGGAIGDGGSGFGITKEGSGTLTLTQNSTFEGNVQLNAGTLQASGASGIPGAFGTGAATLTLNGGTLQLVSDANADYNRAVTVTADTNIRAGLLNAGATSGRDYRFASLSIGAHTLDVRNSGVSSTGNADAEVFIDGATTLTGDATFHIQNAASGSTLRLQGNLGGDFSLTKSGNGILFLNNADNTFSGGLIMGGGTVSANQANSVGTGTLTSISGGTLQLRNANAASINNLDITTAGTRTVALLNNNATTFNINSVDIESGRSMTLNANRINGSNSGISHTFNAVNGITFAGGGTLSAIASNNYDIIVDSAGGGIVTTSGTVNFNATSADLTINDVISGGANINFGGANTSDGGTEGRIFLNAANTYTGNTTISHRSDFAGGAAIVLGTNNVFNTNGNLTFQAGDAADFSTLDLNDFDQTINTLNSTGAASEIITNEGSGLSTLTTGSNNGGGNFLDVIQDGSGTGTIALVKNGSGALDLGGTNTYTGGTTINGGRIDLNNATDTLADTGAITINGGELRVENADTVGLVTLSGGIIGGGGTLTSGSNYATQSGEVSANLAGTVGLDKTTGGTVTISGANTYTGATNVSAGTLDVTGSLTSNITVADGATFAGEGSTTGALALGDASGASGANFLIDVSTQTGAFTSAGLTTDTTNGPVVVSGTGAQSVGILTVLTHNNGGGDLSGSFTLTGGTGIVISGRAGSGIFADDGNVVTLTTGIAQRTWDNGATSGSGGNGLWDTTTENWVEGDHIFAENDTVIFDDTVAGNETVTVSNAGATVNVNNITISHTAASSKNFTFNADTTETLTLSGVLSFDAGATGNNDPVINIQIDGTGSIFVGDSDGVQDNQSSNLILTAANTFSGGVTLSESFLTVRDSSALGTGSVTLTDPGTGNNRDPILNIDRSNLNIANNFIIDSAGGGKQFRLNVSGTGTGEISGDILNNEGNLTNFLVDVRADDTLTLSGNISGVGTIRKTQAGTVVLTDDTNSFERGVLIESGTLQATSVADIGVNSAIGANTVSVGAAGINLGFNANSGTFEYIGATAETDRQVRVGRDRNSQTGDTGGGTIKNSGTGTLTFDNANFNRSAGGDIIADRTLTFETDTTNGGGDIVVSGAIIDNTSITGLIALTKEGSGILTLAGDNTYTGATTVTDGTLFIDGSTAAGSAITVNGGTLGGDGTINGTVNISAGANHTAGTFGTDTATDAGIQTINNTLTYATGATVTWDLISNSVSNAGTDFDQFNLTGGGSLAFDGDLNFDIDFGSAVDFDQSFWNAQLNEWKVWDTGAPNTIPGGTITITNSANSAFNSAFELMSGNRDGSDSNGIWLVQTSAIPEPSTFSLVGLGLAGFGWFARRRRKKASE